MTEINYKALPEHLKQTALQALPTVFLIHGEEFLYKDALGRLLGALFPQARKTSPLTGYEALEGSDQNIPPAIEKLNTYSLLSGETVVALTDARIFDRKQDRGTLLAKAKQALEADETPKAARYLASVVALTGMAFGDLPQGDSEALAAALDTETDQTGWISDLISHCIEQKIPLPAGGESSEILAGAIEKGFVPGNRLIITTDMVDKRRRLYKVLRDQGLVVDCTVPKGDRKNERQAQQAVMMEQMRAVLKKHGKTMENAAYAAIQDLTGFELRTAIGSLEKLVAYTGTRTTITAEDVTKLLKRTKSDPIYALTNAVAARNPTQAFFYLKSLLADNIHPLQAFAAITNQIRKLLLAKSFVDGPAGKSWRPGANFNYFRGQVLPNIVAHDQQLLARLQQDDAAISGQTTDTGSTRAAAKKKKRRAPKGSDLMIAPNPQNAYPIYQLILKSDNFTLNELREGFINLAATDLALKSSRQPPELILERLLFHLSGSDT